MYVCVCVCVCVCVQVSNERKANKSGGARGEQGKKKGEERLYSVQEVFDVKEEGGGDLQFLDHVQILNPRGKK